MLKQELLAFKTQGSFWSIKFFFNVPRRIVITTHILIHPESIKKPYWNIIAYFF